jgi:LysM repeat protein
MKRRTRLIIIGCAIAGTFPTAAQAAFAAPTDRPQVRAVEATHTNASTLTARPAHPGVQPPKVRLTSVSVPLPRVIVTPGDTLSAIGARTGRTWEQLAAYNHISNPNLIYVNQIITVPPASFLATAAPAPGRPVAVTNDTRPSYSSGSAYRPVTHTSTGYTPTYTSSGVWGCIASHESGGNPATNTGNGYYGMYQDTQASWAEGGGLAYAPRADMASAAAQTAVNERIQAQQGWGAWPVTSRMCGA